MIDSHTHLDYFDSPGDAVQRATDVGVAGMVSIGCSLDSIKSTAAIAASYPDRVRMAVGIHPQKAQHFDLADWHHVEQAAQHESVVAIGETGWDQFRDHGPLSVQDPIFIKHTELARAVDMPLVIHTRAAEDHSIAMLDKYASDLTVILHCFSFTEQQHILQVVARDNWVCSFAGNVTYGSADALRSAASQIPLERLMVETDAPYLSPKPHRGEKNEPAFVQHTLQCIADQHEISFDEARLATTQTAARVFDWMPAAAADLVASS